jgi:hypothetical protein
LLFHQESTMNILIDFPQTGKVSAEAQALRDLAGANE